MATGDTPNAPPRSTLYSGPKNTSEYSLYGHATNPGYGRKSELVHSQTSRRSCRAPPRRAPGGRPRPPPGGADERAPTARGGAGRVAAGRGRPQVALAEVGQLGRPRRVAPGVAAGAGGGAGGPGRPVPPPAPAATARPAPRAYASASYQQTCMTGSLDAIGSVRPNATRTHSPSQRQNSGAVRPARCRCAPPPAVHKRRVSSPPQ